MVVRSKSKQKAFLARKAANQRALTDRRRGDYNFVSLITILLDCMPTSKVLFLHVFLQLIITFFSRRRKAANRQGGQGGKKEEEGGGAGCPRHPSHPSSHPSGHAFDVWAHQQRQQHDPVPPRGIACQDPDPASGFRKDTRV